MPNDLTHPEASAERISRFQSFQAGQYWRALRNIAAEGIKKDTVLLIQSIRWVDDAPHTVILRPHPTQIGTQVRLQVRKDDGTTETTWVSYDEHRFLLKDFLAAFEYEPDYQRIRAGEMQRVQERVNTLQQELLAAQSDPSVLAGVVEQSLLDRPKEPQDSGGPSGLSDNLPAASVPAANLPASGMLVDAIGAGLTPARIDAFRSSARREHEIATLKAQWIQGKISEIAETIKALTPFYEEQAAAALARTEEVRDHVGKLLEGIESLELYVGNDVMVTPIREGESAPRREKLVCVQRKLLMDEELSVWDDVDERFDHGDVDRFFDALRAHDSLVEQIFPAPRCVLVMAVTRRYLDYGDEWTNSARNALNKTVFLLVRDGWNVYQVCSPVESHLRAARLFPSKQEQDRVFRGLDGSAIRFEDVAYTDKLAKHEQAALHYRRFLILACGLDHRLKLFGPFYDGPPSLDFVSLDFQERHFRFLHDDDGEGLLPGETRLPVREWIARQNEYLRSGSRVLCQWGEIMNPDTAPAVCGRGNRETGRFDLRYKALRPFDIPVVYRDGDSLCVEAEVSGFSWRANTERTFRCKVDLSKFRPDYWENTDLPFLCLDAASPEDLRWYIQHRGSRRDHLSYIRFFKRALRFVLDEREGERETRERLAAALEEGGIASGPEAREIVDRAVIAWRAAHRGQPLPRVAEGVDRKEWTSLLNQMHGLAGQGGEAAEVGDWVRGEGCEPLRLILSGKATRRMCAGPRYAQRDSKSPLRPRSRRST
ncbi:MAG: hypothetical protein ACYDHY_19630 [Acidiferrobacterales bacterium]